MCRYQMIEEVIVSWIVIYDVLIYDFGASHTVQNHSFAVDSHAAFPDLQPEKLHSVKGFPGSIHHGGFLVIEHCTDILVEEFSEFLMIMIVLFARWSMPNESLVRCL